uniref:Replicative DNA helicase n=1 Tax=Sheathia arcuata TaxID=340433 RepID=A0A3G1I8Z1_9FLOR|nr:replication helicase subunit [Sheathia arcuata]ART65416.1 replication helicase subunit [Sheathia arcuata]
MKKYHIQLPPQHNLAEEILLGGVLINPSIITLTIIELNIESFAIETHQLIYRTMLQVYADHKYIDSITLINTLWEMNLLYEAGGMKKILNLIKQAQIFTPKSVNHITINYYIRIVQDKYFRRLLIQYGYYIIQLAHLASISKTVICFKADKYLHEISNTLERKNSIGIKNLLTNFLLDIKSQNIAVQEKGLKCGFQKIDNIIDGFKNNDLIIVAGRPSMGKTSFGLSVIINIINSTNIKIGIFSLETSKEQILYKLISIASKISLKRLISGDINQVEWVKVQNISTKIINSINYIDDTANLSISHLNSKAKSLKQNNNTIGLIMIDYLQLIQSDDILSSSRTEELSFITRTLKILARDMHIPVIVLSQLNRNVENRVNKKPLLSDLRESGCINGQSIIILKKYNNLISNLKLKNVSLPIITNTKFQNNHIKLKTKQYNYSLQNIYSEVIYSTHNHILLIYNRWKKNDRIKYFNSIQFILQQKNTYIFLLDLINKIYLSLKEIVYDKEISELTSFTINNGLILHNSIEQDADLVLLLYREAYYNKNTNNITEIIIAKHRNGPIGTAELNFNTELAAFENRFDKI